jgi:hypothetical protein
MATDTFFFCRVLTPSTFHTISDCFSILLPMRKFFPFHDFELKTFAVCPAVNSHFLVFHWSGYSRQISFMFSRHFHAFTLLRLPNKQNTLTYSDMSYVLNIHNDSLLLIPNIKLQRCVAHFLPA